MAHATPQDVTDRLGRPLSPAQETQVLAWLGDAERIIRRRLPTLDALVTAGQIAAGDLVSVEAEAVIRKLNNPEGLLEYAVDDARYRRDAVTSRGTVYITDDEWATLLPVEDIAPRGAYSVPLGAPWGVE